MHTQDTIVALSSAPGPAGRAIVRLSGPDVVRVLGALFTSAAPIHASQRCLLSGEIRLPGVAPLAVDVYVWPAPHTYTGQDMAEVHTLGCPPLVELLVTGLLQAGARAAGPGEFTMRAFLAGKLDLTRAEAVQAVIESGSRGELTQALAQLAGGVARPLQELRDDLLNLLADVEAGLDFADEDIHFVATEEVLLRLTRGLAQLTLLGKQLERRGVAERVFRAVLVGRPNAGKSSLFNALGGAAALVSPEPGTTRDYLVQRLDLGGVAVELVDTAGWQPAGGSIEAQAQALGQEQAKVADLLLLCLECGVEVSGAERELLRQVAPPVVAVATKSDRAVAMAGALATSAVTGEGVAELKALLAERARGRAEPALAPSLGRCRHHVEEGLACLRRAHHVALFEEPPELLALEVRGAVDQLGEMVGAVYTDDLLDRIFSRFCIGK
jgi:tRNA modification GTPase